MYDAWVPPLLAKAAPDAKILTILRDPVDRYISGLAFNLSRGAPVHPLVASDAFARGLYGQPTIAPSEVLRCERGYSCCSTSGV